MKDQKKEEEQQWDKRKIFLFLILSLFLVGLGFQLKSILLWESTNSSKNSSQNAKADIKGTSIQEPKSTPDIKKNIQSQINNLKEEAQNINLVEIASSSPQVQKVINDLKALKDYPQSQVRDICEKVCSGL